MPKQPPEADRGIAEQLFVALGSDSSDALRDLFRATTTIQWNELLAQLDNHAQSYFYQAQSYCKRWEQEGPPRPYHPPARIDDYDPYDINNWAATPPESPPPPLEMWQSERAQMWRGQLRGSLKNRFHELGVDEKLVALTPPEARPLQSASCERSSLDVLYALQDLLIAASQGGERAGLEAQDVLFGDGGLHRDLLRIARRKEDYATAFGGEPQPTIKWAPCNGHHALACWCERIGGLVWVRSTSIPRLQEELEAAQRLRDRTSLVLATGRLHEVATQFAAIIAAEWAAFAKDYEWVHQSMRYEIARAVTPAKAQGRLGPTASALDTRSVDGAPRESPPPIAPSLDIGQLPARVLVTLLGREPPVPKVDLHLLHTGPDAKNDPRLSNLLTPSGDLVRRGFIEAERSTVHLTGPGRVEAEMQKSRGTRPLGQTHD